ncbi:hypothetical protein TRVL_03808 [Trypanosoma vivax]|nr:hypothetical protein TRVL_03808 [Trypanosoma vivax]
MKCALKQYLTMHPQAKHGQPRREARHNSLKVECKESAAHRASKETKRHSPASLRPLASPPPPHSCLSGCLDLRLVVYVVRVPCRQHPLLFESQVMIASSYRLFTSPPSAPSAPSRARRFSHLSPTTRKSCVIVVARSHM